MPSTKSAARIGVFYLHRCGNDHIYLKSFIKSLSLYKTAIPYKLIIIAKGFDSEINISAADQYAKKISVDVDYIYVDDSGFDLTAYRKAASAADVDYCLFLNSYSRILCENWLESYWTAHCRLGDNSILGATGSYESYGGHASFPSIHIRTNAFFMRRELFLDFNTPLTTKLDCHLFESGRDSISRRILKNGGNLAIVRREAAAVAPDDWPEAGVFCSGRQENLVVADNRTHAYQISKQRRRWRLSRAVWGKERANVLGDAWFARQLLDVRWRCGSVVP